MKQFLGRLLRASWWGASLVLVAGCGNEVIVDSDGNTLETTPDGTCYGETYSDSFGFHGQCCDEEHCIAPVDGSCPSAQEAVITDAPPGSGECECDERKGPYANSDAASAESCCYLLGSIGCDGRPLLVDNAPRLAPVMPCRGPWAKRPVGADGAADIDVAGLDAGERAEIARRWAERARFEHASIASFARFSMTLLACGAPPELVEAAHAAAVDEIRHARTALAIAAEYAGEPMDLGKLDIRGALSEADSLESAAIATVIEGCVGETLAAIEVAASAAAAGPLRVREALSAIAEDETRHAELSWAFVKWAVVRGGPAVRQRVGTAFSQAFERVGRDAGERDEAGAPEHGFLPGAEVAEL
ncbi:MAG: hypothetical protein R3B70_46665, partial [Polyangiaceae bacterium]